MKKQRNNVSGGAKSRNPTHFTIFFSEPDCMACILSHTSPGDACTASSISRDFKCFADSDIVWERFLPSDYEEIISRSVSPVRYTSKKELYIRLCDSPILLDDGKMSFSLNKHNGKKCFMVAARALNITWADTLIYWRWKDLPESRFPEVALLLAVCWLEIICRIRTRMLSSETKYATYLVYKIGQVSYGLDLPGKTLVRQVGERIEDVETIVYLKPPKNNGENLQGFGYGEVMGGVPQMRKDGWMEIELGRFYNRKTDDQVKMSFMEISDLHWKSGLIIEGIDIRPIDARG